MSYEQLGLKCGIEIHQQLEGKKLFCSCPTELREDHPDFIITRKLRATAGESGEVDIAAKEEQIKDRTFIYQGYFNNTCLVETDSEPPHEVNSEALYTALQFSQLVDAKVPSVVQVMRKIVIDGSNTSGFQRTALLAREGKIQTSDGEVRIENISLEEDSCRTIEEKAEEKTYRLDRLGIPLIEIGTKPDIKTPEQCQETAKKIGLLLRSLPGVKRGLGTIRQDVNISITGGNRIEIKGAQDLKQLPLLVELEAKRQEELLKIRDELKKVKIKLNSLSLVDLTEIFQNTSSSLIRKSLEKNGKVMGIKLSQLAGYPGRELQPDYRIGTEFSGRAKAKAGVGGIFHSDELPDYGISEKEVAEVKDKLKTARSDAFILVCSTEEKAQRALEAVYERVQELFIGVPKEVRKANPDGTTTFQRMMPGASRMYPETDVPLVKPNLKGLRLPETLEEKALRYQKDWGLSSDLASFVAKSDKMLLFEELVDKYPSVKPAFVAETLTSTPLGLKRDFGIDPEKLTDDNFRDLFLYLSQEKIHKDIIFDVLIDLAKGQFNLKHYVSFSTEELHKVIKSIIDKSPGAPFSALMGMCMKALQGKASGKFISEELKRIMDQLSR